MKFNVRIAALLALIPAIAYAAAGDITWPNKNVDGDHIFSVNDGGVTTTVLTLDGATSTINTTQPMVIDLAASNIGLTIQGAVGQTSAAAFTVENSGGTDSFTVAANGVFAFNNGGTINGGVDMVSAMEAEDILYYRLVGNGTGTADCAANNPAGYNSLSEICIASWTSAGAAGSCSVDGGSNNIHLCLALR